MSFIISGDEKLFHELKTYALRTNLREIPYSQRIDFCVPLINFVNRKISHGRTELGLDLFDILEFAIKQKLHIHAGSIMTGFFLSTSLTFLHIKGNDKMESFIKENQLYLNEKQRHSIVNYLRAYAKYIAGDYKNSLLFLNAIDQNDYWRKDQLKILLIKIYFDKKDYIGLLSVIDSFRKFIKTTKEIRDNLKGDILRFTDGVSVLVDSIIKHDRDSVAKAKKHFDLLKNQNVYNKQWLLKKAEEILNPPA